MDKNLLMQEFDIYRLDGHTLRIFASVCETGSVSRTALVFGLNQSTVSHTIDKMRAAVRDPLFVKSGRGITPTEKALAMLDRVQNIIADIEGLVAPEAYDVSRDNRPVVMAIPTPALLSDMKRLFDKLSSVAPKAKLEIRRLAPRSRVNDMLSHDEAELAITISGFKYLATLNHCHYATDDLVVFYDQNCRGPVETAEDYANARHGVVNFGGNVKSEVEVALAKLGLGRVVSLVSPTASMLGDFLKGTDLIATMPKRLAERTYVGLTYCKPPVTLPKIELDLVWHRRYEHSGRNRWLRQLVLSCA